MIRTPEAKQLCNKSELQLYALSLSRSVKGLTEKELLASVQRSRKARDKFRSVSERQRREARGKQEARGKRPSKSSQRTVTKVQLFDETLKRYEKRLAEVKKQASVAAKKASKKKTTKKKSAKKKAVKKSPAKKVTKQRVTKQPATKKKSTQAKKTTGPKSKKVKALRRTKKSAAKYPEAKATKQKRKKPDTTTKSRTSIRATRKTSGIVRKQKHVSAQGRRSQSRRDSR